MHLIRKAGSALGPVLPDLLKAFVLRLATAQTASFSQVRIPNSRQAPNSTVY